MSRYGAGSERGQHQGNDGKQGNLKQKRHGHRKSEFECAQDHAQIRAIDVAEQVVLLQSVRQQNVSHGSEKHRVYNNGRGDTTTRATECRNRPCAINEYVVTRDVTH